MALKVNWCPGAKCCDLKRVKTVSYHYFCDFLWHMRRKERERGLLLKLVILVGTGTLYLTLVGTTRGSQWLQHGRHDQSMPGHWTDSGALQQLTSHGGQAGGIDWSQNRLWSSWWYQPGLRRRYQCHKYDQFVQQLLLEKLSFFNLLLF